MDICLSISYKIKVRFAQNGIFCTKFPAHFSTWFLCFGIASFTPISGLSICNLCFLSQNMVNQEIGEACKDERAFLKVIYILFLIFLAFLSAKGLLPSLFRCYFLALLVALLSSLV